MQKKRLIDSVYTWEDEESDIYLRLNRINRVLNICLMLAVLLITLLVIKGCAYGDVVKTDNIAGYSSDQWADAIRHAEGNSNYGVLAHYKHTTYRQACINTVKHQYRIWNQQGQRERFLLYLSRKYCPVGCDNDNGTNKFWVKNVSYWLRKG